MPTQQQASQLYCVIPLHTEQIHSIKLNLGQTLHREEKKLELLSQHTSSIGSSSPLTTDSCVSLSRWECAVRRLPRSPRAPRYSSIPYINVCKLWPLALSSSWPFAQLFLSDWFWCKGRQAKGKGAKESSVLIFEERIGFVFTPYCVNTSVKNLSCRFTCFVLQNQSSRQTLFLYNIHFISFYRIKLVSIKWACLLVFCHVQ